ncbi:DUF488 family protein [Brachyspira innocens]|uniref:DUF488 domain-containing protein n=1 Tax=Brachyspira innocens TaxID=13264 RepID=UPI0003706E97|nr:DUF488 domain-containing protein [Brachyspira innocens]
MIYRRKIILSLLEEFGNKLNKTDFQKFLFLISQEQLQNTRKSYYHFIPYKYGCFSIQSYSDIEFLKKNNIVRDDTFISKTDDILYAKQLKREDMDIIRKIYKLHGNKDTNELLSFIYKNYPFYSLNSEIIDRYLSQKEISNLKNTIFSKNNYMLFTIGYEGITLEEYINKLIKNNIKLVIDVRKNAVSMKYGFSKYTLKKWLNNINIEYEHIPELGIESEKREELKNQKDYDELFNDYKNTTLINNFKHVEYIFNKFLKHKRIALTCFEALPIQCHRSIVRDAITNLDSWNILEYGVKDL